MAKKNDSKGSSEEPKEKPSFGEKIANAIDHVIHPGGHAESEEKPSGDEKPSEEKPKNEKPSASKAGKSSEDAIASHPKFDKFK